MNPKEHIKLHESEFTKSEKKIMNYVLKHFDTIASYPIQEVAEKCKVSKSALLRFCQKCGFKGYSEFKYEISRHLHSMVAIDSSKTDSIPLYLSLYSNRIHQLEKSLNLSKVNHLISLISQARKIKIYGIHETGLACQYFTYRLCTLGIDSEAIFNSSQMPEKATMSTKDDLNIFLSLSSSTRSIKDAIKCSFEQQSHNILITQNDHFSFRSEVDDAIILPTFNNEDLPFFVDSQALLLVSIDLIIICLAKQLS